MTEHAVVIAGGDPTGLMLAGELALARVDVTIVERRESQDLAGLRTGALHPRTTEVLDQRGIAHCFVSQRQVIRSAPFGVLLSTSATSRLATTTFSRSGRRASSASWSTGSASLRCRSIGDVR